MSIRTRPSSAPSRMYPCIDTRNVQSEVLVDNGETVVLGGVYEQTDRDNSRRVPFFGESAVCRGAVQEFSEYAQQGPSC